jgi:hypothetical protein
MKLFILALFVALPAFAFESTPKEVRDPKIERIQIRLENSGTKEKGDIKARVIHEGGGAGTGGVG